MNDSSSIMRVILYCAVDALLTAAIRVMLMNKKTIENGDKMLVYGFSKWSDGNGLKALEFPSRLWCRC